jgi:23S rRNA (pseudouridine1915-N3)-methyltransferase
MRISLLCIGKTDDKEITSLINYYLNRLPKHWNFEITEIPDVKNAKPLSGSSEKGRSQTIPESY